MHPQNGALLFKKKKQPPVLEFGPTYGGRNRGPATVRTGLTCRSATGVR